MIKNNLTLMDVQILQSSLKKSPFYFKLAFSKLQTDSLTTQTKTQIRNLRYVSRHAQLEYFNKNILLNILSNPNKNGHFRHFSYRHVWNFCSRHFSTIRHRFFLSESKCLNNLIRNRFFFELSIFLLLSRIPIKPMAACHIQRWSLQPWSFRLTTG